MNTKERNNKECIRCGSNIFEVNVMALGELTLGDVNMERRKVGLDPLCSRECVEKWPEPLPTT